jgi:hypothetical protein
MQQAAQTAPSPISSSFAGLLAALTSPAPKPAPAWNDDDLADDVATLSYENALRAHSRYKSPEPSDWPYKQAADPEPFHGHEVPSTGAAPAAKAATPAAAAAWSEDAEPEGRHDLSSALDRNRKCASITIRLSNTECVQLRRRAAEAGLTVSAYLRSCTFEAEALRAQVKETLAELRTATSADKRTARTVNWRSWFGWLTRLLQHWHPGQRMARA